MKAVTVKQINLVIDKANHFTTEHNNTDDTEYMFAGLCYCSTRECAE